MFLINDVVNNLVHFGVVLQWQFMLFFLWAPTPTLSKVKTPHSNKVLAVIQYTHNTRVLSFPWLRVCVCALDLKLC